MTCNLPAKIGETIKTTCPYCGVGCGVLATPKADGSLDIKGDPDHPANFGRLCSKGSALGETVDMNGRLLYPSIKGERTDWNTSLQLVANKFSQTIAEHGPDSVAFYVSGQILTEDYYIANKLMKGFIGSANIDTNSRLCMASSVAGHKRAFGADTVPGTYEDLELADLIVLVGSNLAWCHPVIYQRIVAAKQTNPNMKVVVIDPRRTMTTDIADIYLPIKPDGDVALFNGLLAYLSSHDKIATNYVKNHTNGFDEALKAANSICQKELQEDTGLSSEQLQAFYKLYANTQKTVTVYSQGVNQSASGTDKVNSIINCHLATGRIGKKGMGPFSITGQPNAMGGREVGGLANMLTAHMDLENEQHRDLVQGFWNSPTIANKAGLKAVDLFQNIASGKVKALWIMATNPVDSMPSADMVQQAIIDCPFVVVSDVLQVTDTVRHSDVSLPSLAWGEKDGTVTNSERRISRQRGLLPAPGEAKADWWQMAEVAKRMGFEDAFSYDDVSQIFAEFAELSGLENNSNRDFNISAYQNISADDYNVLTPFQWPQSKGQTESTTRFFANGNFFTPDRKAKFIPTISNTQNTIIGDGQFTLNTGRIRDQWHTMTRTGKSSRLSSHMGEPYCEIHPNDAAKLNIVPVSLVKISNEHGEIFVRALITDRVQVGSVFVPMHWTDQYSSKARVDVLIPSLVDPISGQPALKSAAVNVEPLKASQYGFLISHKKPKLKNGLQYWALSTCDGGWKLEFALLEKQSLNDFVLNSLGFEQEKSDLSFVDDEKQLSSFAWFDQSKLLAGLYLAPTPVEAARSWLTEQLQTDYSNPITRYKIGAGRPGADVPDKGAIVCSCMNVGINEISGSIASGCSSVGAISDATTAGTNCGSCLAEIAVILESKYVQAAE